MQHQEIPPAVHRVKASPNISAMLNRKKQANNNNAKKQLKQPTEADAKTQLPTQTSAKIQ
jgi:hypothetical protein